jgi:ATP-dependent DNA helicase DinG
VPGKALECVVIVKLPFAVPDEPIVEARVEDLREKGRNPFYEYQVPQAVMMFRQGFGRLMRKKDDRGVVALFDPRIYSKPYGRLFIESIPDCQVADDLEQVQIFFEREM